MDRSLKSRSAWCLLCLLPLAAAGCRSASSGVPIWKAQQPQQQPQQQQPQPDSKASVRPPLNMSASGASGKTDFHEKATQTQEFNVHIELGKNKANAGDFEGAVVEYQRALDACSHFTGLLANSNQSAQKAQAHRKLAGALDHLGRFEQAEEHYRSATKAAPNDPRVWNDIGYSYYMQGRLDGALQCLRYAEKLAPDEPEVQTNLGMVLAVSNQPDEALVHLSKAGGSAVGHHNLAFCLASMGKQDEAREHYRKALELQPQLPKAHEALARLNAMPLPGQGPTDLAQRDVPQLQTLPRTLPQPGLVQSDAPALQIAPAPVASGATPLPLDDSVRRSSLPLTDTTDSGIPWEK